HGYVNQPDLTAASFTEIPANTGRLRAYRTGDVVRLIDDQLHYLGRSDDQVKVRGYRIEPGEVEAVALGLRGVREAVAVTVSTAAGHPRLELALIADPSAGRPQEIREQLARVLPAQLVPAAVRPVDRIPRTPSGKADRRAVAAMLQERRRGRGQPGAS